MTVPVESLAWLEAGTGQLARLVAELPDGEWGGPTLLPGWDRHTLIAHLALNAGALANLVSWARTEVESPMYPSPEARAAGIAGLAQASVAEVRRSFVDSDAGFRRDLAAFEGPQWSATVRTARGRAVPASEIPWMRNREVWVHAVDLNTGFTFADIPVPVLSGLLDDAAGLMSARPDAVGITATATDTGGTWSFGPSTVSRVEGPLVELCAWALGRDPGTPWPPLPAWL